MEFSFDRSSNEAQLRNNTQSSGPAAQAPTPPKQPVPQAAAAPDDGIDTSTIANERLRKAIEKNRARQAERARMNTSQATPQASANEQASLFDKQQQQQQQQKESEELRQAEPESPPPRPRAQERTHESPQARSQPRASAVVTRKSVARPDEAEFTPVKRTPRKVASQISYTTTSRKKSKPLDPTLVGYLVKGCWIFCVIMVLRLIFASGGVTDYYSQRSLHNDRIEELLRIKKENMVLVQEIERMKSDTAFQKKLVRDNLGFIAADEFLVLFPKEK